MPPTVGAVDRRGGSGRTAPSSACAAVEPVGGDGRSASCSARSSPSILRRGGSVGPSWPGPGVL